MPKIKKVTVVHKCQCNRCGQVAHVETGKEHFSCKGFTPEFYSKIPANLRDIRGRKGTWVLWTAPVLQVASEEPIEETPPTLRCPVSAS